MVNEKQEERFASWERALRILKETIKTCGLIDFSEYRGDELQDNRWAIYKREYQGDISLVILVSGLFGTLHWEFFLIKGVRQIIQELEHLLRRPGVDKLFNLSEEEDIEEIVNLHTRAMLNNYIYFLPAKMYQSLDQTLDDTIRGYIKNVIEPSFKAHWKSLDLPDSFTLLPHNELHKYDKQLEDLRKIFIGNKRPKLTAAQLKSIIEQYQTLRRAYAEARIFHNQSRETFFKHNPTIQDKDEAWRKTWAAMSSNMFSSLRHECLELLPDLNYPPYELARKHLSLSYRYSDEYMRNLLKNAKKGEKAKKNINHGKTVKPKR